MRIFMSEIYYYKGLHKVKVLTESEGYWIVEALEDFEDFVDDQKVTVKAGERRIVQTSELQKKKVGSNGSRANVPTKIGKVS